ncbi:MAG: hypothetical protein JXA37_13580 [Chloroflexia bacterium]|nr:hypothetical protein [Chloroflexia bacterium]
MKKPWRLIIFVLTVPENWELVGLFECEPQVALPSAPWSNNQLTFVSRRGDDHMVCEIEPGTLTFRWWRGGLEHISLQLIAVQGLNIEMTSEEETLTVFFQDGGSFFHPLRIQLKPFICIRTH